MNFTQSEKRFVLSLQHNGSNGFLFANATKIYQFKVKDSEKKDYALCLVIFQKVLQLIIWKKTGFKGMDKLFFVDFNFYWY